MKCFYRLTLLTLAFGISACGQKGPLYLPAKPPAVSTPYPTAERKESMLEDVKAIPD